MTKINPDMCSLTMRILRLAAEFDDYGELWWRTEGEYAPITFFVNCNDLFYWACSDAEVITEDNINILEQSYIDAVKAEKHGECYASELFCCRVRGMRPQGAYYKYIPCAMWSLFDACGPERALDEPGNTQRPVLNFDNSNQEQK